jgi:hypothetical protein
MFCVHICSTWLFQFPVSRKMSFNWFCTLTKDLFLTFLPIFTFYPHFSPFSSFVTCQLVVSFGCASDERFPRFPGIFRLTHWISRVFFLWQGLFLVFTDQLRRLFATKSARRRSEKWHSRVAAAGQRRRQRDTRPPTRPVLPPAWSSRCLLGLDGWLAPSSPDY